MVTLYAPDLHYTVAANSQLWVPNPFSPYDASSSPERGGLFAVGGSQSLLFIWQFDRRSVCQNCSSIFRGFETFVHQLGLMR